MGQALVILLLATLCPCDMLHTTIQWLIWAAVVFGGLYLGSPVRGEIP